MSLLHSSLGDDVMSLRVASLDVILQIVGWTYLSLLARLSPMYLARYTCYDISIMFISSYKMFALIN